MERVDEAYLNDILSTKKDEDDQQSDDGSSKPKAGDVKVIAESISYEEILELVRCSLVALQICISKYFLFPPSLFFPV